MVICNLGSSSPARPPAAGVHRSQRTQLQLALAAQATVQLFGERLCDRREAPADQRPLRGPPHPGEAAGEGPGDAPRRACRMPGHIRRARCMGSHGWGGVLDPACMQACTKPVQRHAGLHPVRAVLGPARRACRWRMSPCRRRCRGHIAPMPCDSGSRLRPLPLPLAQVKVKRRGSDTKYVAQVLAMGVECDIALLTGKRARRPGLLPTRQGVPAGIPAGIIARSAPAGQRRQRRPLVPQLVHSREPEDSPATLLPSSSLVSELLVRGHTARATRRAQRCCRSWAPPPLRRLHSGRNFRSARSASHRVPSRHASRCARFAVEDESFWEGLEPVCFGGLPRLQDSVTVIG